MVSNDSKHFFPAGNNQHQNDFYYISRGCQFSRHANIAIHVEFNDGIDYFVLQFIFQTSCKTD